MRLEPTPEEVLRRDLILDEVLRCIRDGRLIRLPDFDPALARPSDRFALINIGMEPNLFGGSVGCYRFQFEGEEDLLHVIVTREAGDSISVAEAQAVAGFVLKDLSPALIWLKPA